MHIYVYIYMYTTINKVVVKSTLKAYIGRCLAVWASSDYIRARIYKSEVIWEEKNIYVYNLAELYTRWNLIPVHD